MSERDAFRAGFNFGRHAGSYGETADEAYERYRRGQTPSGVKVHAKFSEALAEVMRNAAGADQVITDGAFAVDLANQEYLRQVEP